MRYYPVFLDLQGSSCLIVGAGDVGRRKLKGLLSCNPAQVLVLDTCDPGNAFDCFREHKAVHLEIRAVIPEDIHEKTLVFACTGSAEVNAQIAQFCREQGRHCNVIDDPTAGDFIVPAHFSSGDIVVALSTGGHSPALAKRIKTEMQNYLGGRFAALATLMGRIRPLVLALGNETQQNTLLFRELVNSELVDALETGDACVAERLLHNILPSALHSHIGELLHDLT